MAYTIHTLKRADTEQSPLSSLPGGASGVNPSLDYENPWDGESMASNPPTQPKTPQQKTKQLIHKPHMITFVDIMQANPNIEKLMSEIFSDQNDGNVLNDIAQQYKKFPRVNN